MTSHDRAVIGTRGSALALWQANWVAERLRRAHPGLEVELQIIKTSGDRFQDASLAALGGKGAFTKEIEDALLARSVDVAVHSLKDLPTTQPQGLRVWAHPVRFDPRDAWVGRDSVRYAELGDSPVIATGSLRRGAQARYRYPRAVIEPLRGNVDTRLKKFRDGGMHGMFMAMAGLVRLDLGAHVTEALEPEAFLPAPGQGALALEGRDDEAARELLQPLDEADTRDPVTAERALLAFLEGGCQVPIGALARLEGDLLVLDGLIADIDGRELLRAGERGPRDRARELGETLARRLLAAGGDRILRRLRPVHG